MWCTDINSNKNVHDTNLTLAVKHKNGTFMVSLVNCMEKSKFVDSPKYPTMTLEWINDDRTIILEQISLLKGQFTKFIIYTTSNWWNLIDLWEEQTKNSLEINIYSYAFWSVREIWDLQPKARSKNYCSSFPTKNLLYDIRRHEIKHTGRIKYIIMLLS